MSTHTLALGAIGARPVGGEVSRPREKDDFYPTPNSATEGFCAEIGGELRRLGGKVWEPACGDGAMARILTQAGFEVVSSDLIYRGYGTGDVDFLTAPVPEGVRHVVTNPPFKHAHEFILRCHSEPQIQTYSMFLKQTYFNAKKRITLFKETKPTYIMPLTWRVDFTGQGRPTMDCMWVYWDKSRPHSPCIFSPMIKPKKGAQK